MRMPEAKMVRMLRMLKMMLNLGTCRARTCLVGGVGLCIPHGPGLGLSVTACHVTLLCEVTGRCQFWYVMMYDTIFE